MKDLQTDNQRLWDLVRHQRIELHIVGLITDDEYAELAQDHGAVKRLEELDRTNRCEHGVWKSDHCYDCDKLRRASSCQS